MLSIKTRLLILLCAAIIIVILLREESINALSIAWPFCIFTFVGGIWFAFFNKGIFKQILGMAMLLSPLYLIPMFNHLSRAIAGVF